jgi:hypothetical protein
MEKGAVPFRSKYDFASMDASTPEDVMRAISWLTKSPHEYKTVILDPITVYWEALQKKWSNIFLERDKKGVGYKHEYYDLQPTHWGTIKDEFKEMMRALFALDMNIVVVCREKVRYKDAGFMIKDGQMPDCEKNLAYLFDVNVHCIRDEDGKRKGVCIRDRFGRLPEGESFPLEYKIFERLFSDMRLNETAVAVPLITDEQKETIIKLLDELGFTPEDLGQSLANKYGVTAIGNLKKEEADEVIEMTQAKVDAAT